MYNVITESLRNQVIESGIPTLTRDGQMYISRENVLDILGIKTSLKKYLEEAKLNLQDYYIISVPSIGKDTPVCAYLPLTLVSDMASAAMKH